MTREEKIDKILDELSDDFIKVDLPLMEKMTLFAKVQNAVHYIETLSSEPCDDAISRQAVLDHIYGINGLEGLELSNVFEKHYADFIKSLPPVQPIRPKGEWIFQEITNAYYVTGQCSRCTQRNRIDNFCPNCGAKMEGAKE